MPSNITHLRPQKINTIRVLNDAGRVNEDSHMSFGFPSLKSALDDIPSSGGTLFIELGTKSCREIASVSVSGVSIVGAGKMGTVLQAYTSSVNPIINLNVSTTDCSIRDMTLYGNNKTNTLLKFGSASRRNVVDNCRFLDCLSSNILLDDSVYNAIRDCYFDQTGFTTVGVFAADASHDTLVERCYFDGISWGVKTGVNDGSPPANRLRILNNIFSSDTIGIVLRDGSGHSIMNNDLLICTNGISLGETSYSVIDSIVEGNYFYGCSYMLSLTNSDRCYFGPGNKYDTPGVMAITLYSGSSNNVIWNLYGSSMIDSGSDNVWINKSSSMINMKTPVFGVDGIIKPLTSSNNGIAVRVGSGSPDDSSGGNQDGCLYLDTVSGYLYARVTSSWKYTALT